MSVVVPRRSRVRTLLLWAAPVTWLGCGGGGGTDVVLPSLSVTTSTQGVELDPDGYSLLVDGSSNQPIGPAATLVIERLDEGQHTLELTGLAPNCSAQGENPRTIMVRPGATASTAFSVQCGATTGSIEVTSAITGTGSDLDGFAVLLDGGDRGTIGVNATMTLAGVGAGLHTVGLTGVAANCQVAGENPRSVTVTAGQPSQAAFSLTCNSPGPAPGTLQVTTTTTGQVPDPDGYGISVDGGSSQPVGASATLLLPSISAGQHSVQLTGVAGNCTVSGSNPRPVTIPGGGTITAAFAVVCSSVPPGTGTLQVSAATTGSSPDPDGYTFTVDNAGGRPIQVNGTVSVSNLPGGDHTVRLAGLAPNCTTSDNPRTVTIASGQTATITFAVTCTATGPSTGELRVTTVTSGSATDPDGYTVSIDGGAAQPVASNGTRTVNGLSAGAHTADLNGVAGNCTVSGGGTRSFTITAGQTATVSFAVSCAATGPSINLRIERMYLTQSTQTSDGNVPLVQGRDAYVRVFVSASVANSARPAVRLSFFRNGSSNPIQTLLIASPGNSTPTQVQEGVLESSWNTRIPAALIQPNTTVQAAVDPDNEVAETNEGDNSFPGTPRSLTVRTVPPVAIEFVPIQQAANGLVGTVGNPANLVDLARRMHPLNEIRTTVHPVYLTETLLPLESNDGNEAWIRILEELDLIRMAEGNENQHYFGLVRVNYGAGVNGIGYVNTPTALGSDDPGNIAQVVAHELGHNWGRYHSPCGTRDGLDPLEPYPYSSGNIGVYGLDVARERLHSPSEPDIMGYCLDPWISDYTYRKVLEFRASAASATSAVRRGKQPSMIVWGRIENGRLVLEPAFQVVTRPSLPSKPGPYTIEATAANGASLFSLSFEATQVADKGNGSRHFAFAVPLDPARAAQLKTLRLRGPGAQLSAVAQSPSDIRRGVPALDKVTLRREGDAAALEWDAGAHPMIMVRDPETGQVLSLARGGSVRIPTGRAALDLEVSDGVRSYGLRRAISR